MPFLKSWENRKGFPGEGPRNSSAGLRRNVDLQRQRTLAPNTVVRRAGLVLLLSEWMLKQFSIDFDTWVQQAEVHVVAAMLARYGQYCYDTYVSRSDFSETINGVVDRRRGLRGGMTAAWDVNLVWRSLMPWYNHVPTPRRFMRALISLSLIWGWLDMAVCLSLFWVGFLRPVEMFRLGPFAIRLPSQMLIDPPSDLVEWPIIKVGLGSHTRA